MRRGAAWDHHGLGHRGAVEHLDHRDRVGQLPVLVVSRRVAWPGRGRGRGQGKGRVPGKGARGGSTGWRHTGWRHTGLRHGAWGGSTGLQHGAWGGTTGLRHGAASAPTRVGHAARVLRAAGGWQAGRVRRRPAGRPGERGGAGRGGTYGGQVADEVFPPGALPQDGVADPRVEHATVDHEEDEGVAGRLHGR